MLIAALEAGGAQMTCSIGTPRGGVLQRAAIVTGEPEDTVAQMVDFFGKFDVKALGIGSFGPLDLNPASPTYGCITRTPKAGWQGYPLLEALRTRLHIPAKIDTNANVMALGEHTMGAGKGMSSLLYLSVGVGIGGGLVVGGQVVHGLVHPELGHMIMNIEPGDGMPDGVCPFHRHCLEGLASGKAMEARWGLAPKLMTQDHPAWALEAAYIAQACVNAILTVSPEIIVLGGEIIRQGNLLPQIRRQVLSLLGGYVASDKLTPEGIEGYIVAPALGVNAGVTGALLLGAQALSDEETK